MNPANLDRVTKAVIVIIVGIGGKVLKNKNHNNNQIICDFSDWKRSPVESNEDYIESLKNMEDAVDGLNDE